VKRSPIERRTPLARGDSELKRTPLARGEAGLKRSTLKARPRVKRSAEETRLAERFHTLVCRGARCAGCGRGGRLEAHHAVGRRFLKRYARERGWDTQRALRLVWDPLLGVPVCPDCHQNHERAARKLPRGVISPAAMALIEQLGFGRVVDRSYL
jgi:hypothetical protein